MELKICRNCRRLFQYIYGPELCPDCAKLAKEEREHKNVEPNMHFSANEESKKALSPEGKATFMEEEDIFEQVRDYILNHPGASVAQLAEIFDITPSKIFSWIKEERLEFCKTSQSAWFTCEKCGCKIKSGRFCYQCKPR